MKDGLERLVFYDKGTIQRKDGQIMHQINFAYACDQKTFGRDDMIPNPYLKSYRVKDADGKARVSHADYLAEPVYQRLKRYAATEGISASSVWDGMVNAKVNRFISRGGEDMVYVDLTEQAENAGEIAAPTQPFDEQAHNHFVRVSLAENGRRQADSSRVKKEDIGMNGNTAEQKHLTRILVKDFGVRTGKDGKSYHRVNFSYACDQMKIGEDTPMAYTYLQTVSNNKKSGKTYTSRDYYLSDDNYDRLMGQVSTAGCENSRWTGVVNAEVGKCGTKEGYRMMLNLSDRAVRKGFLQMPDVPFDEAKHNAFVRASQKTIQEQRVADAESRLPHEVVQENNRGLEM